MTRALVIGYGSIGARHARILSELGCATAVVSKRAVDFPRVHADLGLALAEHAPDYVVIANATSNHQPTLSALAALGYHGTVLVEKPLFDHAQSLPMHAFRLAAVAYNLRFHPIIRRLRDQLVGEDILSVQAYVGQYLPDWRPGTDYRRSYSASSEQGGGVLRDLSHELDYLTWMLGDWMRLVALGGHVSPLEITSDDVFSLLMTTTRCPIVSVQLNYLDRRVRRRIIINTAKHTLEADLVQGTVTIDSDIEVVAAERDATYRSMHKALLDGHSDVACSLHEGMGILRLIDAAELSIQRQEWITQ